MKETTDHTSEVEKRLTAIPIKATDCCAFFSLREGALLAMRECWYCIYGSFRRDSDDPHQPGFCKLKVVEVGGVVVDTK